MSFLMRGRSPWHRRDQTHPRAAEPATEPVAAVTVLPVTAPAPGSGTDDLRASALLATVPDSEPALATPGIASTNAAYALVEPIGRIAQEAAKAYDKHAEAWTEQGLIEALLAAVVPAVRQQAAEIALRQAAELRWAADITFDGLPQTPDTKRLLNARAAEIELAAKRITRGDR